MDKIILDLDLLTYIHFEGVSVSCYIGEADSPSFETTVKFDDLLSDLVDHHSVPGCEPYMLAHHKDDALKELSTIKDAFDQAYKKAKKEIENRATNDQ